MLDELIEWGNKDNAVRALLSCLDQVQVTSQ